MQKRLINGVFKAAYKTCQKLKGEEREKAITELSERMNIYEIAEDFAEYYPKIYTKDVLERIVNASNNIEAANIMTTLRRKIA